MNNINGSVDTSEQFNLAEFEVEEGYFKARILSYEEKYKAAFPRGWGQFFAEYLSGQTDKGNLDYDDWAFLCDHFMSESWIPPGSSPEQCHEMPEATSGISILGDQVCSIPIRILAISTVPSNTLPPGLRR